MKTNSHFFQDEFLTVFRPQDFDTIDTWSEATNMAYEDYEEGESTQDIEHCVIIVNNSLDSYCFSHKHKSLTQTIDYDDWQEGRESRIVIKNIETLEDAIERIKKLPPYTKLGKMLI